MSSAVIVGAGVAGTQTALELRHRGFGGPVLILGEEAAEPYDRPPLSKDFLKGNAGREALGLLPASSAADKAIDIEPQARVASIDRAHRELRMADGSIRSYDHLVLATGARNRPLPVPGADLAGVCGLRTVEDAERLREALAPGTRVVIVGGGFIGLEVAAAAIARGAAPTVVEYLPRVMARVLSPAMSQHFEAQHANHGVRVLTGAAVSEVVEGAAGRAAGVRLADGSIVEADVVVVGIGVVPATELADAAGLDVADGIVVDAQLRTTDPSIFAIGDCARFECRVSGRQLRLESIQNAADQARFVADRIISDSQRDLPERGDDPAYEALPWFWSEQFDSKLQIAGAAPADADSVARGDVDSASFSVCRFVGDRLVAVESVNAAKDHVGARKLLAAPASSRTRATRDAVADPAVPLKSLIDV